MQPTRCLIGSKPSLGLYVTAHEAYQMWQANQERIKLLDVRTFEEYVLIGHAEMAMNIPLAFPTYKWDAGRGNYSVVMNADFIAHVQERFTPDDTILICAGLVIAVPGRSMRWPRRVLRRYITSLMVLKGTKWKTPKASIYGKRMRNGWKNSAPWTYDLNPELVWIPSEEELEILSKPWISDLAPELSW